MGEYFLVVNPDQKQYIDPHVMGTGLRLREILYSGIANVLLYLTIYDGDDTRDRYEWRGAWTNNRIVVTGDYDVSNLYHEARDHFENISEPLRKEWNRVVLNGLDPDEKALTYALPPGLSKRWNIMDEMNVKWPELTDEQRQTIMNYINLHLIYEDIDNHAMAERLMIEARAAAFISKI